MSSSQPVQPRWYFNNGNDENACWRLFEVRFEIGSFGITAFRLIITKIRQTEYQTNYIITRRMDVRFEANIYTK